MQVDIESTSGHPFFVYGKGWASCKPDYTLDEFGLKCQPLEVGDVCISLRPRETLSSSSLSSSSSSSLSSTSTSSSRSNGSPASKAQQTQQSQPKSAYIKHQPQYYSQPQLNLNLNYGGNNHINTDTLPQNLSRKQIPQTIPTTATATAVTSRPVPPFDFQSSQYAHHLQQQHRHQMSAAQLFNEHNMAMRQHYLHSTGIPATDTNSLHRLHTHDDRRNQVYGSSASNLANGINNGTVASVAAAAAAAAFHHALSHDSSPQKYHLHSQAAALHLPPPPSSSADSIIIDDRRSGSPDIIDVTGLSGGNRKRRWSAPDNICDVDGCQLEQKKCTKH